MCFPQPGSHFTVMQIVLNRVRENGIIMAIMAHNVIIFQVPNVKVVSHVEIAVVLFSTDIKSKSQPKDLGKANNSPARYLLFIDNRCATAESQISVFTLFSNHSVDLILFNVKHMYFNVLCE